MQNIKWNFKIAFRNLLKSKVATTINLTGIAVGLTTSLLLLTFVKKQFETDAFLQNYEQIYRVERGERGIWLPFSAVEAIKENVPGIEKITCFHKSFSSHNIVSYKENNYKLEDVILADPEFFNVFQYKGVYGDLSNCLDNPNSIVLCSSQAKKLFGNQNPVGKTVKYTTAGYRNGEYIFTVTAVIQDPPDNTSIRFQNILSQRFSRNNQIEYQSSRSWRSSNFITYALLNKNADPENVTQTIKTTIKNFSPEEIQENYERYRLNALKGIYFDSVDYWAVTQNTGKKPVVIFLGIIGILILLIAGVNYFNLVLAQSKKRLKAIGASKIVGANKLNILGQTLLETLMILVVSILLSMLLVKLLVPYFNNLVDQIISFRDIFSLKNSFVILSALCTIIILFGLIPSIAAIRQNPINTLKGDIGKKQTDSNFKYGLIIFQFVITIGLIVSLLVIRTQHKFLVNSDYGINKENIYCLQLNPSIQDETDYLAHEFLKNPSVENIAYGFDYLGDFAQGGTAKMRANGEELDIDFSEYHVYGDFINILGLKILNGHGFNTRQPIDNEVIVNKAFVDKFGIKDLNLPISFYYERKDFNIIGVVDDFNYKSKYLPIEPLLFRQNKSWSNIMFIKLNTTSFTETQSVLASFKNLWKKNIDIFPFEGEFLSSHYENIYQSETKFMKIIFSFSLLSIFLACLGLFGITKYLNQLRIKEIGVRKVNGANRLEILQFLNQSLLIQIAIAFIIACPATWYLNSLWLNNFAYKIPISWWIIGLSGALVLTVALITVSWQSWRTATKNPVEALRYE